MLTTAGGSGGVSKLGLATDHQTTALFVAHVVQKQVVAGASPLIPVEYAPLCVPGSTAEFAQAAAEAPPSAGPQKIVIDGAASPMSVTCPLSVAVPVVTEPGGRFWTVAVPGGIS